MSALRKVPWSLAAGMILSVAFFSYAWSSNHQLVAPILVGGYLTEGLNRIVRSPVWVNQLLFFVLNGLVWGLFVFLTWSVVARLRTRKPGGAT
jgi:hypothetical protein